MLFRKEYGFMSNMYPSPIFVHINGRRLLFNNVEAAYQAHKCPDRVDEFVGLDGITAKKLGRMVSVRPDWDDIKLDVMRTCIDAKFDSSFSLRQQLVDVTDSIVEDNTWGDTFWGRCNGYGSNYLGQILTQKRDQIIKEKDTPVSRNKGNSIIDFPDEYVVIDLETTGINPRYERIIEVSALRCNNGNVQSYFSTLIHPMKLIPGKISELTGITNDMVRDAPEIKDALPAFLKYVGDTPIVGYGVNFDINFIYDVNRKLNGTDFKNDYIDVMRMATKQLGGKKKLTDVAAHYGVNMSTAHRSLNDCVMCNDCLTALKQDILASGKSLTDFKALFVNDTSRSYTAGKNVIAIDDADSPYNGKSFKSSFGSYSFTDDDISHLIAGDEIEIKGFRTKAGKVIDIRGKLGQNRLPNGKFYFGFQRTDLRKSIDVPVSSASDDYNFSK